LHLTKTAAWPYQNVPKPDVEKATPKAAYRQSKTFLKEQSGESPSKQLPDVFTRLTTHRTLLNTAQSHRYISPTSHHPTVRYDSAKKASFISFEETVFEKRPWIKGASKSN
jgi:hypothetical protein